MDERFRIDETGHLASRSDLWWGLVPALLLAATAFAALRSRRRVALIPMPLLVAIGLFLPTVPFNSSPDPTLGVLVFAVLTALLLVAVAVDEVLRRRRCQAERAT